MADLSRGDESRDPYLTKLLDNRLVKLTYRLYNKHPKDGTNQCLMQIFIEELDLSTPYPQIQIYYDGLCQLCSREINHYKKNAYASRVEFIDITDANFNAKEQGLDPHLVHKHLHVKTLDQQIYTGIDAFIIIWRTLKGYSLLATLIELPIVNSLAKGGYCIFARIRPLLPKRKVMCEASPYCDLNQTKDKIENISDKHKL